MMKYAITTLLKANRADYPVRMNKADIAARIGLAEDQFELVSDYSGVEGRFAPYLGQLATTEERQASLDRALSLMDSKDPSLYITVRVDEGISEGGVVFDAYPPCGALPSVTYVQQYVQFYIVTDQPFENKVIDWSPDSELNPGYYRYLTRNVPLRIADANVPVVSPDHNDVLVATIKVSLPDSFMTTMLPESMWVESIVVGGVEYRSESFRNVSLGVTDGYLVMGVASSELSSHDGRITDIAVGYCHGYRNVAGIPPVVEQFRALLTDEDTCIC